MENSYKIKMINPKTFTEKDWNDYYKFRIKACDIKEVDMHFDSMNALRQFDMKNIKDNGEERYMVWKNDKVNGIFLFNIEFEDDLKERFTYFNNYMIEKKLDGNLLNIIFTKFIKYDEKSNGLAIHSINGMNDFVTDLFNVDLGSISELFELEVKKADLEKIESWLSDVPKKFSNLRIEFYIDIPDNLLEEYASLFTQLLDDMPQKAELGSTKITAAGVKSDQELGKVGNYCSYRYLVFNENNQLIAMTNVSIDLKHPQEVNQYMTGVMKKYRGGGLSKWLKAAMFKKLLSDFPELEKIKTDTQPLNHPSRELSKQMGYKQKGVEKDFLISKSKIIEYLKREGN